LSPVSAFAGQFSVADLGVLGHFSPSTSGMISERLATAINNSGQVVGYSIAPDKAFHGFLYQGGVLHDLGTANASAVNANGQVVGWSSTASGSDLPIRFNGGIQPLGALPGGDGSGRALGINDAGVIVGSAYAGSGQVHAFRYQGGTMQDLGTLGSSTDRHNQVYSLSQADAINAAGQIVGRSTVSLPQVSLPVIIDHAFLYDHGQMHDLGTLTSIGGVSEATAINASGQVVGYSSINEVGGPFHAFLYDHGQMHDLGLLNGDPSLSLQATGINDQGQIVGFGLNNSGPEAFLYDHGHMYNLNDLIPRDSGWKLYSATGINDLGQIVGDGVNSQGETHAFLLTPASSLTAPEPGTLALLSVGAVSLAGYGWRRRGHLPIVGGGSHGK
jgi:probable HAF family extracellular repeat protein